MHPSVVHTLQTASQKLLGQFHMEPQLGGGLKVCSNDPGYMTKVATMPVYGKNLSKICFSEPNRPMTIELNDSGPTKFVQKMSLG